ncbi:MAG: VWA domain-containing protein [Caldilinea sp.]
MRKRLFRPMVCGWLFVAALLCLFMVVGSPVIARAGPTLEPNVGDSPPPTIILNEVMPKPDGSGFEWIEIYHYDPAVAPQFLFLPVINRSATGFTDLQGSVADAIAANDNIIPGAGIDISGWQIADAGGVLYTIPDALPPIPPGYFVVIYFDGQGAAADHYSFAAGAAALHTPSGVVDTLDDRADQVALYKGGIHTPATLCDFVAWGEPPQNSSDGVASGRWPAGAYLEFAASGGYVGPADEQLHLTPNEAVGRFPGFADTWAIYRSSQLTPGRANPMPLPAFSRPASGDKIDAANLVIGWSVMPHTTGYRFQLARSASFGDLVVDTVTPFADYHHTGTLAPGLYYWRVAVQTTDGRTGPWSTPAMLEAVDLGAVTVAAPDAEKTLGIVWQVQHKDTFLLDVSGHNSKSGDSAWDVAHPAAHRVSEHDNHYCQVAGMSMINSYYGGDISQDRLSYYAIREYPDSKRGLDPDRLCTFPAECMPDVKDDFWAGRNKGMEALVWSLGYAWNDYSQIEWHSYNPPTTTVPFNDLKGWIDANRPLLVTIPGHVMVIDGYRTTPSQQIHLLDPWTAAAWFDYTSNSIQRINNVVVYKAPGSAGAPPAPRSDEASITTDSDGDGVRDFDEVRRFHTDPFHPDSDGDWVRDKQDILETVYDLAGTYVYTPTQVDYDADGLRKELDWDNDADGHPDGCEDANRNGAYEPALGESSNYNAASHLACTPLFDILYPLKVNKANAGDPAAPSKILVQVSTAVPAHWPLSLSAGDFTVRIGGLNSPVISAYPSGDTYFLVVDPHAQGSAGDYDLEVVLGAQTDSETDAVRYLPKNPSDAVIVMDRSGSMLTDDKIGAAKNAASAFVDMFDDGDWVGIASFATTSSADYALHEISDAVRAAANTAINAFVADGMTALGQGAQTGYGLLTVAGHTDHDWTMILLSDGWENVAPYWAGVAGGINNVVVHTVGLGDDANRTLLESIAGAKHGTYFYVAVDPPAAPVAAAAPPPLFVDTLLPNRLADVYVAAGELSRGWQRIFDAHGEMLEQKAIPFEVVIERGLPSAIFTLNWDSPSSYLILRLLDPDGKPVTPDQALRTATHHQLRVMTPAAGKWTVAVEREIGAQEFHLMVSAQTDTTLLAAIGGAPGLRTPREPVTILGILTDRAPIRGATVYALVTGPASAHILELHDDGSHDDGKAGDGVYAARFAHTDAPGGYAVKLFAAGVNNAGEPFTRYAQAGFEVGYRALYVWHTDQETGYQYEGLLEANGWLVDRRRLNEIPTTDLRAYHLLVIGPDTGSHGVFASPDIAGHLLQYPYPVLGLGQGGAAFFDQAGLAIGWLDSWVSDNHMVYVVDPTSRYWHEPLVVELLERRAQLYGAPLEELGVYTPKPPASLTPIGREPDDQDHYPVIRETHGERSFILWGYSLDPNAMTEAGRKLMVNLSHSMR